MKALAPVAALLMLLQPALAANQLILGRLLVVKNPGPDSADRRIKVIGRESAGQNTVVGDPAASGAKLLVTATGTLTHGQVFDMPAAGWSATPGGFRYRDPLGAYGPVRSALVASAGGRFLVRAALVGRFGPGPQPHVTVTPPNPGISGGASLEISDGDTYCLAFGGSAGGAVTNLPPGNAFKVFAVDKPTAETECPGCSMQADGFCRGFCSILFQTCQKVAGVCTCFEGVTTSTSTSTSTSATTPVCPTTSTLGIPNCGAGPACSLPCLSGQACVDPGNGQCACSGPAFCGGTYSTCGGQCPPGTSCTEFAVPPGCPSVGCDCR